MLISLVNILYIKDGDVFTESVHFLINISIGLIEPTYERLTSLGTPNEPSPLQKEINCLPSNKLEVNV